MTLKRFPRGKIGEGWGGPRRSWREAASRGQGLVEFALVVMFIFFLVSGFIGIGHAFFLHLALRDAAQEGAAYAAVRSTSNPTDPDITARAQDVMAGTLNPSDVEVLVTPMGALCAGINPMSERSNAMRVQVSYDMPIIVPFLGAIVGSDTWTLTGTAEDTILIPSC